MKELGFLSKQHRANTTKNILLLLLFQDCVQSRNVSNKRMFLVVLVPCFLLRLIRRSRHFAPKLEFQFIIFYHLSKLQSVNVQY